MLCQVTIAKVIQTVQGFFIPRNVILLHPLGKLQRLPHGKHLVGVQGQAHIRSYDTAGQLYPLHIPVKPCPEIRTHLHLYDPMSM